MEKTGLPPPSAKRLVKTALHQAVLDERLHQVRLLVDKHGAPIDTKDVHGRTALMLSCIIDNDDLGHRMASILMKAGASLNVRDTMGRTTLTYACMNGREAAVALLLREDVLDINEPDNDGNTPLHHAGQAGNPRIVAMLAKAFHKFGLNADRRNGLGYTAMLLACKAGHYVSGHLLLTTAQASPSLRDGEFHLNAREWVDRSHQIHARCVDRSALTSAPPATPRPKGALSFSREGSMYARPWVPICRMYREHAEPMPRAATADSLKLPDIVTSSGEGRSEVLMDGLDARQILLTEIEVHVAKQRPCSPAKTSRWGHPSTAKLRAVASRGSGGGVVPDMVTMFRMYCDQYQPDWRSLSKRRRHVVSTVMSPSGHSLTDLTVPLDVAS